MCIKFTIPICFPDANIKQANDSLFQKNTAIIKQNNLIFKHMKHKIFFLILFFWCINVYAVDSIQYRGKKIPIKAVEEIMHPRVSKLPEIRLFNSIELQEINRCVFNHIIPKLKNGTITVQDDESISYNGYVTYFDHKWDKRKERRKYKLKYNPHEIGEYCLYMLFDTLNYLWYNY